MTEEQRLAQHVAWSQGPGLPPWVGFVFTDEPDALRRLQASARATLPQGLVDRILTPRTPARLRQALSTLLGEPAAALVWVCALHDEPTTTPPGPWTEAWDWLMLRANERRQLILAHLQGGLIFAAPTSAKARFREAAPDLWSTRALVLEPPPTEPPPPPVSSADRARIAEALQRAAIREAVGSRAWLALASSPAPEPLVELRHALAEGRPDLDWREPPFDPEALREAPTRPTVCAAPPTELRALPPSIRERAAFEVHFGTWAPARDLDELDATWRALDLAPSPLDRLDALERTAAAILQQGWASEAAEVATDLVEEAVRLPAGPERDRRRASGLELRARARRDLGLVEEALGDVDRASILRRHLGALGAPEGRSERARASSLRGQLLLDQGDLDAAEAALGEALALRRAQVAWSDDADALAELALSTSLLGDLHLARGDAGLDLAEEAFRDALRLRRRLAEETGADRHRRALAHTFGRLGGVLARRGRWREARATHEQALALATERAEALPENATAAVDAATARLELAAACAALGDLDAARGQLRAAVTTCRALVAEAPENARWAALLAEATGRLAALAPAKR